MIGGLRLTVRRSGDGKQSDSDADHTVVGFEVDSGGSYVRIRTRRSPTQGNKARESKDQ